MKCEESVSYIFVIIKLDEAHPTLQSEKIG